MNTSLKEQLDKAQAEYEKCSEELAAMLEDAKSNLTPEIMERIRLHNQRCNELMEKYLDAYRAYYSVNDTE